MPIHSESIAAARNFIAIFMFFHCLSIVVCGS
jgi:hypothetical protein